MTVRQPLPFTAQALIRTEPLTFVRPNLPGFRRKLVWQISELILGSLEPQMSVAPASWRSMPR